MMKVSPEENEAIKVVCEYGREFGYGNLMAHLSSAWARSLVDQGWEEPAAQAAARGLGYPIAMHVDILERGEWDETGARYQPKKKAGRK